MVDVKVYIFRGIAQLVEQWSPKPRAEGSNPSAPANILAQTLGLSHFLLSIFESSNLQFFVQKHNLLFFVYSISKFDTP